MKKLNYFEKKFDYYKRLFFGPVLNDDRSEIEGNIVGKQEEFEYVAMPEHGSHKLAVLKHILTNQLFVQKYLNSSTSIAKEYMMALFLHAIYPHNPKPLLLEDAHYSISVLSNKKDKTQDLEQFIRAGRTPELLTKKVKGLAAALGYAGAIGKLSDQKCANICVTDEDENTLRFYIVDNERAHLPTRSFFNSGEITFITKPEELVNTLYDLYPPSEENHAGLAGDERMKEFKAAVLKRLRKDDIKKAYRTLSEVDTGEIYQTCQRIAGNSLLFRGSNSCKAYKDHFDAIKQKAAEVVETEFATVSGSPHCAS